MTDNNVETNENPLVNNDVETNSTTAEPLPKKQKISLCPICVYSVDRTQVLDSTIEFCSKHLQSTFTCLVPDCFLVFTNMVTFVSHYRMHLNLPRKSYICHKCYSVMGSKVSKSESKHQHNEFIGECCSTQFPSMAEMVKHKFLSHQVEMYSTTSKPAKSTPEVDLSSEFSGELFTCVVPGCKKVFTNQQNNLDHYRHHADLTNEYSTCRVCLKDTRKVKGFLNVCDHINDMIYCPFCGIHFSTLYESAIHKIDTHYALIACGENNIVGCPVCSLVFDCDVSPTEHYIKCFTKMILESESYEAMCNGSRNISGTLKCKYCDVHSATVKEYLGHSAGAHKNIYVLKETGIQLCPLCDKNYAVQDFVSHIEKCTDSLKIGDNQYGCAYCKEVYSDLSPVLFRHHFIYCKSFKVNIDCNNKRHFKCLNCTFESHDDDSCIDHANYQCIYHQLKKKYAMGPNEQDEVVRRLQLQEKYSNTDGQSVVNQTQHNDSNRKTLHCDLSRYKLLKDAQYLCNVCNRLFYNDFVFKEHIDASGRKCRQTKTWYCRQCVSDFSSEDDFRAHKLVNDHLAKVPDAVPINSSLHVKEVKVEDSESIQNIKNELFDSEMLDVSNDDVIMEENEDDYYSKPVIAYQPDDSIYGPSTSHQQSEESIYGPSTSYQQFEGSIYDPNTSHQNSSNLSQNPSTSHQQPEGSIYGPSTSYQQPEGSIYDPSTSHQNPSTSTASGKYDIYPIPNVTDVNEDKLFCVNIGDVNYIARYSTGGYKSDSSSSYDSD